MLFPFFPLCLQGPPGPTGLQGVIGAPGPAVSRIFFSNIYLFFLNYNCWSLQYKKKKSFRWKCFLVAAPALVSLLPEEKLNPRYCKWSAFNHQPGKDSASAGPCRGLQQTWGARSSKAGNAPELNNNWSEKDLFLPAGQTVHVDS